MLIGNCIPDVSSSEATSSKSTHQSSSTWWSYFSSVERNQANDLPQPNPLDEANSDKHGDINRPSTKRSPKYSKEYCECDNFLAANPISNPALAMAPNAAPAVKRELTAPMIFAV
jgi:hypothetical protein